MRFVIACILGFGASGCAGHVAHVSFSASHHVRSVPSATAHHRTVVRAPGHVHRGLFGHWVRTTRSHRGHVVHRFFVFDHDGRWRSGRLGAHGTIVDARGRWAVRDGVLFVHRGVGWQRFARVHASGHTLRLSFSDGRHQVWRRR